MKLKTKIALTSALLFTATIAPIAVACHGFKQTNNPDNDQKQKNDTITPPEELNPFGLDQTSQTQSNVVTFKKNEKLHYVTPLTLSNVQHKFIEVSLKPKTSTLSNDQLIKSERSQLIGNNVVVEFKALEADQEYMITDINGYESKTSTKQTPIELTEELKSKTFKAKPIFFTSFVDHTASEVFNDRYYPELEKQAKNNLDTFKSMDWYNLENDLYLSILYDHYSKNGAVNFNPLDYYEGAKKITKAQAKHFDEKAKTLGQESYIKAALKGYTLPVYKPNSNEVQGLSIRENIVLQKNAIAEGAINATGTPRTIGGDKYKDPALQTVSINFLRSLREGVTNTVSGTMWILDFVPRDDGKYPTKWYFATNVHVAKELIDLVGGVSFTVLNKDAKLDKVQKLTALDSDYSTLNIPADLNQKFISTIYTATDFLNSKPADFLVPNQATKFKDIEEFVDFAVLEVDFEQIAKINDAFVLQGGKTEAKDQQKNKSAEELAKLITNEYATKTDKHIKFAKNSYLKNFDQIDGPILDNRKWKDQLFVVGYPATSANAEIDQVRANGNVLWTNSFYVNLTQEQKNNPTYQNLGNLLSKQLGYRSFIDKAGIADGFIAIPKTEPTPQTYNKKQYFNMALEYLISNFAAGGGSSGSSVRNQNNEIVAIVHLGNTNALLSVASAIRSEGFDYNGLYGKYNLPQYDLVYGGGKDQKSSFREALKARYGDNFKTNLFKNGVKDIPTEFLFVK